MHIHNVGLVHLYLGGDDRQIREGHNGGSLGVLDADHDGLSFPNGDVGDKPVEGSARDGSIENIKVGALTGERLGDLGPLGVGLRECLCPGSLTLGHGRRRDVVGGFLAVEVLLGDQLFVVEILSSTEVKGLLFKIRPWLARCWRRRFVPRRRRS